MSLPENPSAFPSGDMRGCEPGYGMTLRDYFAAHVDISAYAAASTFEENEGRAPTITELAAYIAAIRFAEADAMLAERAKSVEASTEALQHVAYFDEGEFHWMSGIAPRDCELYAKAKGGAA